MEVRLTTDQQAKLTQLANDKGLDVDALAQEAIDSYLEAEFRFVEAVKLGEAELEREEYLTHEEVGARIDKLFRS
jgi:predicted transcriptional regulator